MTEPEVGLVRLATAEDEPGIVELCRRRNAETGIGAFSADKVRDVIRRSFDRGCNNPSYIGVIGNESLEGSIGLAIDAPWDSETPILSCLWHYVLPEYRHSPRSKDMIVWALGVSRDVGLPIRLEVVDYYRTKAQIRLYTRQLGPPVTLAWLCERFEGEARADGLA